MRSTSAVEINIQAVSAWFIASVLQNVRSHHFGRTDFNVKSGKA
jgi:hypothetical protein